MIRRNADGSISVGVLDDFAKHMNAPIIEDTPEKEPEETPKKPAMAKKTVKK